MPTQSKSKAPVIKGFHARSMHHGRYDLAALCEAQPALKGYLTERVPGEQTIDFSKPEAVKLLNMALLKHHYGIQHWNIPTGYLTPPVPGRADHIHHLADVLATELGGKLAQGPAIRMLDIGVGSNCIYPLIASTVYGWTCVGTDIDDTALASANKIINSNPQIKDLITTRKQENTAHMLTGIIDGLEKYDMTMCNPPFHASAEEARKANMRKTKNLKGKKVKAPVLNFGGQHGELWCEGGEKQFLKQMITESRKHSGRSLWYSSLVSKQENLRSVYRLLKDLKAEHIKTISFEHGNKSSRIVAWTFQSDKERQRWVNERWKGESPLESVERSARRAERRSTEAREEREDKLHVDKEDRKFTLKKRDKRD